MIWHVIDGVTGNVLIKSYAFIYAFHILSIGRCLLKLKLYLFYYRIFSYVFCREQRGGKKTHLFLNFMKGEKKSQAVLIKSSVYRSPFISKPSNSKMLCHVYCFRPIKSNDICNFLFGWFLPFGEIIGTCWSHKGESYNYLSDKIRVTCLVKHLVHTVTGLRN